MILQPRKWVQNGYTLAHHEGRAVFVHGALPGEEVRAEVVQSNARLLFARALEILSPAPERIANDCAVFPQCGGCSFRHLGYEAELQLKLDLLNEHKHLRAVREELRENGITERVHASPPDGYRARTRLHVRRDGDGVSLGFYAPSSHDIIDLPEDGCKQLDPEINAVLIEDRQKFRDDPGSVPPARAGKRGARRDPSMIIDALDDLEIAGLDWQRPDGAFSQTNRHLVRPWLDALRSLVPAGQPNTIELFCGHGLIGGFVRDLLGERYDGYDNHAASLKFARRNFQTRAFAGNFHSLDLYNNAVAPDRETGLALVNPPRAGLAREQIDAFAGTVPAVLYSSCNAATLDRDLGALLTHGYAPKALHVFDFFPRTPHVELVILVER